MRIIQEGSRLAIYGGSTQLWIDPWGTDGVRVRMSNEPQMDPNDWALSEPVEALIPTITWEEVDTTDPWYRTEEFAHYHQTGRIWTFTNGKLTVTVNTSRISCDGLLALWREQEITAEKTAYAARSLRLSESISPEKLPGFAEGYFLVQDEASALAVEALGAQRGDTVVDVCSAPGGKILSLATGIGGEGCFYAFDLHESKLSLIRASAARLGVDVAVSMCDATKGEPRLLGKADRVICDVPCSGLGVLGKKPDLRYRERSEGLASLGYEILQNSKKYLKTGGVLLYSTCTLSPDENEENVRRFLAAEPDFVPLAFSFSGGLESADGMLTLLPHKHGTDGFFMAKLKKIN